MGQGKKIQAEDSGGGGFFKTLQETERYIDEENATQEKNTTAAWPRSTFGTAAGRIE